MIGLKEDGGSGDIFDVNSKACAVKWLYWPPTKGTGEPHDQWLFYENSSWTAASNWVHHKNKGMKACCDQVSSAGCPSWRWTHPCWLMPLQNAVHGCCDGSHQPLNPLCSSCWRWDAPCSNSSFYFLTVDFIHIIWQPSVKALHQSSKQSHLQACDPIVCRSWTFSDVWYWGMDIGWLCVPFKTGE